ncbi:permease-like cell division protein FtsX [Fusobacterium sp. PH5-44]|uniref:permease-like cell division protein FtsX n=1 Tax=unclassified Fusobacterium TaxID=2648384 RepID=UPI003D1FD7BB
MDLDIMNFNNNVIKRKTNPSPQRNNIGNGGGDSSPLRVVWLRKKTIIPFIIAFFFLNFISATIINLYEMSQNMESNHFISIDIRANISPLEIENLEKEILSIYAVKNVKYVSKEQSFKELQEQLGIAIPESENSLSDSMMIYFRSRADLKDLQERIENMPEVKETYIDEIHMKFKEERSKFYRLLIVVIFGTLFIPTLFLLTFIFYNGFLIDFSNNYLSVQNERMARKNAKVSGILPLLFSSIVGSLIFLNVYLYLRKMLVLNIGESYTLLSLKEFVLYQIIVNAILCIIILITPLWPSKYDGGGK